MSGGGLEVHALHIERGERILCRDLSFAAPPGTLVHLQGDNGSGKTSLLRTIAGLLTPDAGEVRWHGVAAGDAHDFAAALNFVGHAPGLNAELSARENLAFFAALAAATPRCGLDAALDALEARDLAARLVRQLSAGQRQRVALARLVLLDTSLWLLDEPFTALDQRARGLVENLIDGHIDAGGIVVIATHQVWQSRHRRQPVTLAAIVS